MNKIINIKIGGAGDDTTDNKNIKLKLKLC